MTLEVIATSVDDAIAAAKGGADRLELVTDLARGGMTPALDVLDRVLGAVKIPVRVMLRETEAHDVADPPLRRRLVELARELGVRPVGGVVCGFLRGGAVDMLLTAAIADACGHPITFHRAIEDCADPLRAAADLSEIPAVDHVLTSGGTGDWDARASRLVDLAHAAAPGIRVIVGGGVTEALLDSIARLAPAVTDVHVGRAARRAGEIGEPVDEARVAEIRKRLDQALQ